MDNADNILGTKFYTYHEDNLVWLGLLTPGGVFAESMNEIDWIDWLRGELVKSHIAKSDTVFKPFINSL